jgi:hypothetical protein
MAIYSFWSQFTRRHYDCLVFAAYSIIKTDRARSVSAGRGTRLHSLQDQLFCFTPSKISYFFSLSWGSALLLHFLQDRLLLFVLSEISSFASLSPRSAFFSFEEEDANTYHIHDSEWQERSEFEKSCRRSGGKRVSIE